MTAAPAGGRTASTRDRLLDSAWQITCVSGWSEVTMGRIAQATGVSRQTVYNELGTRPALGQALVLREVERFLAVVEEHLDAEDDIVEAIRAIARALLVMAADNPLLHAVVSASHGVTAGRTRGGAADLLPLLTTDAQPVIELATAVVSQGVSERYPDLGLEGRALSDGVESVVRLVLSYIMQPSGPAEEIADRVAWIAERVLRP